LFSFGVDKMGKKHPLLNDKPSGTLPKTSRSKYIDDLFKRADKAIEKLKRMFEE
jgi:hypothetical protein